MPPKTLAQLGTERKAIDKQIDKLRKDRRKVQEQEDVLLNAAEADRKANPSAGGESQTI